MQKLIVAAIAVLQSTVAIGQELDTGWSDRLKYLNADRSKCPLALFGEVFDFATYATMPACSHSRSPSPL